MRPSEPLSPLGVGLTMAYRGLTLGLEFVLPTLGGYALDRRWGTEPWLVLLGAVSGFAIGMIHLLRIVGERSGPGDAGRPPKHPG